MSLPVTPSRFSAATIAIAIGGLCSLAEPAHAGTHDDPSMPVTSAPAQAAPAASASRPSASRPASRSGARAAPAKSRSASRARGAKKARRGGSFSTSRACLPDSLKRALSEIEQRWGAVRIVSTQRRGAVIAGSGKTSMHSGCRAVDFHPAAGTHKQVVGWLRANHAGGLGTYGCAMHHIHIDNGPNVRWHHCVNSRGKPVRK